jgi:dTDP-4-amino-4,6-dideoxygalactose transaminase
MVREFEQQIARYHDVKYCVATCNGTIALEMAIKALGLEGEVIVPSFTFPATAHALLWQAIKPVFADIDPKTHNLAPASVEAVIGESTTGILAVHLWGRTAPVRELQEIADKHNLKLLFDSAHAFGCSRNGVKVGNFGECEILSFHATKFFNTFEGGAVLTNNQKVAETIGLMRNFGFAGVDEVVHPGTNGKMNEMSAAMGLTNLESIGERIEYNRFVYNCYKKAFEGVPSVTLLQYDESESNNYQYIVIMLDERCNVARDRVVEALQAENVMARRYFWPGCHRMKPFEQSMDDLQKPLVNTESISDRVIVLPAGVSVDKGAVNAIASIIAMLVYDAECN